MERYLQAQIRADLKDKMVFVAGPRQVGKTTLAKKILGSRKGYFSWDVDLDRERILKQELGVSSLWVFDEIHKYRSWRNYLKGIYDGREPGQQILVVGSARLDYYRYGGDSLQGRYHYLRFHPLSVAELGIQNNMELLDLLDLGPFPEPFFRGSKARAKRWSLEYRTRLIREELTDLERIVDLGNLELLSIRLPELVGNPLSINALREDLRVSHKAVANWVRILERLYSIFLISPYGHPLIRAIQKAQKHYHFDWSVLPEPAARWENLVGAHLLKWVHFEEDTKGRALELRYFRDEDGREVDFVVTEDRRPILLIECKWDDSPLSKELRYLKERFPAARAWQLSAIGKKDFKSPEGIRVSPALTFLRDLC